MSYVILTNLLLLLLACLLARLCACIHRGGFFRRVFLAQDEVKQQNVVVKVPAYNPWIPFDNSAWDSTWTEAVVNDALSPHGRIVDMYSFCGLSIMSQAMEKGDLYGVAAPHYERCQQDLPRNAWELRNDLTGRQKVQYALEMAQSLAVLHNHPGGTIVHNDVQVSQFLLNSGNEIKLTDFNRATVKKWSAKDPNQPCVYSYFKTPGSVSCRRRRRVDGVPNLLTATLTLPALFVIRAGSGRIRLRRSFG